MRKILQLFLSFLLVLSQSRSVRAELLQIIHTNDLHSHLDWANDPSRGGYAAVKAAIDGLRARASAQGIDTLVLDAGDFSEGSVFYLADRGAGVWRMMDHLGYDAVALGNHDWMMGAKGVDDVVGRVRPGFELVAANFIYPAHFQNLARKLRPSASFRRAGARIAVLGLTTDEPTYNWTAQDGFISNPEYETVQRLPALRRDNDFVIALTHLGVSRDRILAQAFPGIDLVIGGHSHTELREPIYVKNRDGRRIPIVQAGEHTAHVGDLLVDVTPGQALQVIRYGLVEIQSGGPRDAEIEHEITRVQEQLGDEYGRAWLQEVVGSSNVPLEKQVTTPTPWSRLVADGIRASAHADVAIDVPAFSGQNQPAGPVTRERIIRNYPRMFGFERKHGWTVWTAQVRGWILQAALQAALQADAKVTFSGISYRLATRRNGKKQVKSLKVGGRAIQLLKNYTVALPEGIGRGVVEVHPAISKVIKRPKDTGTPVWSAIEAQFRSLGGPLSDD